MKSSKGSAGLLNLDVLALSLLCCLLASVVGILVLNDDIRSQSEGQRAFQNLTAQTAHLFADIQVVERSRKDIINKINYSQLERANREMLGRIREIEEKITLAAVIAKTETESARLKVELQTTETNQRRTSDVQRMLGSYKGSYILIECVEDAAIVYPGKTRIESNISGERLAKLLGRIGQAGFVAIVVRPGGWYSNSYDALKNTLYAELEKIEKADGRIIGRSVLPLDSADLITNYLPPESAP